MKTKAFFTLMFLFVSIFVFSQSGDQQVIDQENAAWEPEIVNILIGLVVGAIAGYLLGKRSSN
jgi:hypothetical protein